MKFLHPTPHTRTGQNPQGGQVFNLTSHLTPKEGGGHLSLVLICGPNGAGKTRLLRALAGLLRAHADKSSAILYCSAHELVEDLVESIKRGSCTDFRNNLMTYRALLIDNIWILERWPHAAREIFFCLRECLRRGNSVFLASDLTPAEISAWSEEIRDIINKASFVHLRNAKIQDLTP